MRSKEEILRESSKAQAKDHTWDTTISKHEQLTIEVWLDIRDLISTMINVLISLREHLQGNI